MLATSSAIDPRSIACASDDTGGITNSRGITLQSFAIRNGTAAIPRFTCRPWVNA